MDVQNVKRVHHIMLKVTKMAYLRGHQSWCTSCQTKVWIFFLFDGCVIKCKFAEVIIDSVRSWKSHDKYVTLSIKDYNYTWIVD